MQLSNNELICIFLKFILNYIYKRQGMHLKKKEINIKKTCLKLTFGINVVVYVYFSKFNLNF